MSTEVDARRLKILQQEWTAEMLSRHFLLTPDDLKLVLLTRRPHNRLGFALQLLLLRLLNFVLPSLDETPEPVVGFVGQQLEVTPGEFAKYGQRPQTRDEHLRQIRSYLGVRAYESGDEAPLQRHLVETAMQQADTASLLEEAEAWLRGERILFPSGEVLARLTGSARKRAEGRIYQRIFKRLTEPQMTAMQALLDRPHGKRGTEFSWLKEPPGKASNRAIVQLTQKLNLLRSVGVDEVDLSWLNRNRARQLASLGRRYSSHAMQRFADKKRWAIMVCWLQDQQEVVTDDIVTMLDLLIGRLFSKSEAEMRADQARQGKITNQCLLTMRKAVRVVLDRTVSSPDLRCAIFEAVAEEELQRAYADSGEVQRPEDYNSYDYAKKRHKNLRGFLPAVLSTLPLTGNQSAQPVLEAVKTLQGLNADRKRKLPADAPTDFADESWRKVIQPSPDTLDKAMWELCLAEKLRSRIKSADLYVVGSRQHRDWTTYLHSPEVWEQRQESWFGDWHAATDPDAYLDHLEALMDQSLQSVADGWKENDFATIVKGKLQLTRDDKAEASPSAEALKKTVQDLLPRVKLAALLPEVDSWIGLGECFSHPAATGRPNSLPDANFFAVLLAHACNLSLATMADSADLPYQQLVYMSDWHFREECLREALVKAVNYHYSLPLAASFGPGTAAMSDGIRFGVSGNSLPPRHHPRYFGMRRGITIYDTTSDQYSQPYVQVIGCHVREGAPALDAALRHETDLPLVEHMTDTHGYTEMVFGLFELVSRMFSPRIADLADQRLYPMSARQRKGPLKELFRGPRIQREIIKRGWLDMHRVGASLKDGTVSATLLVAKFHAMERQSGIHQCIQELGRIHKTLFILRYISDPDFRRRIHRMLNKGEALHSLAREVCFARGGIFRERDLESLLNKASCLSLVINAIVVWNTRYMMAAFDHLRSIGYPVRDEDLTTLSPLLWEHINMHGAYHFDLAGVQKRQGLRPLRLT